MSKSQNIKIEKLVNAITAINKIVNCEISIKTAFRLSSLIKELNKHLETYNENRQKLIKKYSVEDEGNQIIEKEKIHKFNEEVSQLGAEEIKIDIPEITLDMFEGIKLSTCDIMSIEWLFSDK